MMQKTVDDSSRHRIMYVNAVRLAVSRGHMSRNAGRELVRSYDNYEG